MRSKIVGLWGCWVVGLRGCGVVGLWGCWVVGGLGANIWHKIRKSKRILIVRLLGVLAQKIGQKSNLETPKYPQIAHFGSFFGIFWWFFAKNPKNIKKSQGLGNRRAPSQKVSTLFIKKCPPGGPPRAPQRDQKVSKNTKNRVRSCFFCWNVSRMIFFSDFASSGEFFWRCSVKLCCFSIELLSLRTFVFDDPYSVLEGFPLFQKTPSEKTGIYFLKSRPSKTTLSETILGWFFVDFDLILAPKSQKIGQKGSSKKRTIFD